MQVIDKAYGKHKSDPENLYRWVKRAVHRCERRDTRQQIKSGNWEDTTYIKPRTKILSVI